jgi:hypothetical protein
LFPQFQRLQQFAAAPEPEIPVTYPHTRLKELIEQWKDENNEDIEATHALAFELRDYVLAYQEQAQQEVTAPEAEEVYAAIRAAIKLHLEACEMLIEAMEEGRVEDCELILSKAAEGDRASAQANDDATRYRSESGITG